MKRTLFILTILSTICTTAQVIHVDLGPGYWVESVTPSTLIAQGSETRLDLDGDGVDDYYFRLDFASFSAWWWCHIDTDSNNEMASVYPLAGTSPFPIPFPDSLHNGDLIDTGLTWADLSLNVNGVLGMRQNTLNVNQPHIANAGDHYIGLRFDISGNTHYAWMRLNATVDPGTMTVTVKEYAYEATPNTPISVGDTGGMNSVQELTTPIRTIAAFPNPSNGMVTLDIPSDLEYDRLVIMNPSGIEVSNDLNKNGPFDISELQAGMYMIRLTQEGRLVARTRIIKTQ